MAENNWKEKSLKWSASMHRVGIQRFDQTHEHLVDLLAQLVWRLEAEPMPAEVDESWLMAMNCARQLEVYGRGHFAAEEEAMREEGYPDRMDHFKAHLQLGDRLTRFRKMVNGRDQEPCRREARELKDLMIDHIYKYDRNYAPFFKGKERPVLGPYR